jgi:hypothetical protein
VPRTVVIVQVKNSAFSDVDEESNIFAAFFQMLIATTQFLIHAANRLGTEDITAEQAYAGVTKFFSRIWTSPSVCLFK